MREIIRTARDRGVRHILSISPHRNDHDHIRSLLADPSWTLHKANCLGDSLSVMRRHPVGVVVCERDLLPGTWVDVLDTLALLEDAPPLIVSSRLADERLWAEALNLGAYDVLAKPFDPEELSRTLDLAFLRWHHRYDETKADARTSRAIA